MIGFGEEVRDHVFGSASRSLEFHRWALTWENQTEDCCLLCFSYWYAKVSLPVTMSQTRSDLRSFNFWKRVKAPLHPPLLRSAGGVPNGRNASIH